MANILVVGSTKGGVGKSTIAYELAYLLEGVLVDFEWDWGAISRRWGYRPEDRSSSRLLRAIEKGQTPRPLKGFRKPDLVPMSEDLVDVGLGAEEFADLVTGWAGEWDYPWVVVDTHPGASAPARGAMAAAHVICAPTGLRTEDLSATQQLVQDMADYPLIVVPNLVPRIPPAPELRRLASIVHGTPVRVGPPIPYARQIGERKRRMAMSAEDPTPKAFTGAVQAYKDLATYVKGYLA
ncbi:hypothetical protein [Barrientosiimonas humi]|uniref:hypothetical protein n=1 Tax=Barrientosiimonas humi TaxID=999931 RepID=UPI00370D1F71